MKNGPMIHEALRFSRWLLVLSWILLGVPTETRAASPTLNADAHDPACGVSISQQASQVVVAWQLENEDRCRIVYDLTKNKPLIQSVAIATGGEPWKTVVKSADPVLMLRIGKRDLAKRNGWTIFFDRMQRKPHQLFKAELDRNQAVASSNSKRATLRIGELKVGPFQGYLQWTFYAGHSFVLQEAVVETDQNEVAYLYDTGLVFHETLPTALTWQDTKGALQTGRPTELQETQLHAVQGRAISGQFSNGSIALFPPPHRYFYPLDFSNNFKNIWTGAHFNDQALPFGYGIRHDPDGDNRYVPWFNAPPGTTQKLGLFWLLSQRAGTQSLAEVGRLTRNDRFAPLPGHRVFTSHYHVEHTRELLESQEAERAASQPRSVGSLPGGGTYQIPDRLRDPGFVRTLQRHGVDIVHLAEFHNGRTPRRNQQQRIERLKLLHAECRRLSNKDFLLLPGEEPNVHLGGHWISFFPQPVYWVLNRPDGVPFAKEHPKLGKIYHVGGEADMLRLLKAEGGLAWTAHPRIKGSTGFPDRYRKQLFYESDRFLGAAWKAMPADLSQPRLGSRVLDLLDDMSNWGPPKYVLGEVDVFKIEPSHELYAHMNVNYLKIDTIPRFQDGWQPILDTLRNGQFFVTTGEVLIPEFTVNGSSPGAVAKLTKKQSAKVTLNLQWTFPLDYAALITGDGRTIKRQRLDLSDTTAFGQKTWAVEIDLTGQRWVRLEIWDIATNGAFTQPIWLSQEGNSNDK